MKLEKELYNVIEDLMENAMALLMILREKTPSDDLLSSEQSLDDAITFLHNYDDERRRTTRVD